MAEPQHQKGIFQVHIDLDLPHALNKFYKGPSNDDAANDDYSHTLLKRATTFFSEHQIKATFFVITQDLKLNRYAALLKELSLSGHEIASHTHTHPYFNESSPIAQIEEESRRSYEEINSFFGAPPAGFRSPGFFITDEMLQVLIETGYKYDSSLFCSPLMVLLDFGARLRGVRTNYSRRKPIDLNALKHKSFREVPLPACLGLPYYNNLNLYFPRPLRDLMIFMGSRGKNSPYLFHLIEFADLESDRQYLPAAILKHPNILTPLKKKLQFAGKIITQLKKQGVNKLTKDCV
ncbi:MAG: polysaccharide deacetylase family protein [Nitrospinales bacterium]